MAATGLAAAAILGLTAQAARRGCTHRLHIWPDWRALGARGSGAWARAVQLAAVAPVLLAAPPCQLALHSAVSCWGRNLAVPVPCREGSCCSLFLGRHAAKVIAS